MAAEIKNILSDFLELLITANKSQYKKKILYEADVKLAHLKFEIRASKDLAFIKNKQYEILTVKLSEIGKLLGGWIKASK